MGTTTVIVPQSSPANAPDTAESAAYENSRVVKASIGVLYGISGYNSGPAQFLQIHDSATVPADTAVPKLVIAIPTASNFSIDFGAYGLGLKKGGIVVCNSTTAPTKTIGAQDCWFNARYK
ncbi:hypothetical protein D9M73_65830 [compost metagenome]|nr:MAG TPA: hypothetical protein [Caudoviricetes sp.]